MFHRIRGNHHEKLSDFVGLDDDFPRESTMPDVDDAMSFETSSR